MLNENFILKRVSIMMIHDFNWTLNIERFSPYMGKVSFTITWWIVKSPITSLHCDLDLVKGKVKS